MKNRRQGASVALSTDGNMLVIGGFTVDAGNSLITGKKFLKKKGSINES